MNRSPPYAATIPTNGTRAQVLDTLATFDGSGSAQGTPRDALPRATMNEPRYIPNCSDCRKGQCSGKRFFKRVQNGL